MKDQNAGRKETLIYDSSLGIVKEINYHIQQWYRYLVQKQHILWTRPSKEHLFFQDRSIRTISLTIGNYDVDGRDGIFVVRLSAKMFSDAFRLLTNSNLSIELQNNQGDIVYSSFPELSNENAKEWIEMTSELEYSGFKVRALINKKAIIDKVNQIDAFGTLVIILVLLMTFIFSLILSLSLVRPIKVLLKLMRKVENGDFNVRFSSKYSDEIGYLGLGFNKMILRVSELIQQVYVVRMDKMESELRQKEATILAMQNQINPHFLYNTLEAINCHAIVNDIPSISQMSKALSDFFRYSIDKQHTEARLNEEVLHIQTYFKIQQERYPEIEIDLAIPDAFMQYPMIKLTLQPIIENAYNHAFIGERDYLLKIYGENISDNMYALYIEDNGEGLEDEQIQRMNQQFNSQDQSYLSDDDLRNSHGIGLLNVHFRIRLWFGEPFGLNIFESESGGLTIRILLPKQLLSK